MRDDWIGLILLGVVQGILCLYVGWNYTGFTAGLFCVLEGILCGAFLFAGLEQRQKYKEN